MNDEGLAAAGAANPFRLPRNHPGIGSLGCVRRTGGNDVADAPAATVVLQRGTFSLESGHGSISGIPVQCPCAGRRAEIAVDQIRTVSKERLGRRLDRLARPLAAQLRQLITEMYGQSR